MQVNMLGAKSKLSSLVAAVEQGEEVILARDGVPVAKIVKYDKPRVKPPGAWYGLVPTSPDWNSPQTNAVVERLFYDERINRVPSPSARQASKGSRPQNDSKWSASQVEGQK